MTLVIPTLGMPGFVDTLFGQIVLKTCLNPLSQQARQPFYPFQTARPVWRLAMPKMEGGII